MRATAREGLASDERLSIETIFHEEVPLVALHA